MSALPPRGKLVDRRPSMKGVLMQDVSAGAERSRAWPKKRPNIKNNKTLEQMEWFRQAQWAAKYIPPAMYVAFADAVKGTPLLPRDLLTMMFAGRMMNFNLPEGRKINSMSTMASVSDSLDVFTQTPGKSLMRGAQFWEAVDLIAGTRAGCQLRRPANFLATTAGNPHAIPWTIEDRDEALYWNPASPTEINIPLTGWYTATLQTNRNGASGSYAGLSLAINGVQYWNHGFIPRTTGAGLILTVTWSFYALTGQKVTFRVNDDTNNRNYSDCKLVVVGNS